MPILTVEKLTKSFGGLTAVSNVNMVLNEGEMVGLIGPNGAGKTTVFNLLTGVYKPTSGTVTLTRNGTDQVISGRKPCDICKLGLARTFQNIRLFNSATIMENLMIACQQTIQYSAIQGCLRTKQFRKEEHGAQERCRNILEKFGLLEYKDFTASKLPYGSQRRVEIMRALMTDPKVLLLDEPAAGMNEEETATLAAMIKYLQKEYSLTILIIDHHMDLIMDICDRLSVINFGKLLMTGTPEQAQNDPKVIDAYLGVDD